MNNKYLIRYTLLGMTLLCGTMLTMLHPFPAKHTPIPMSKIISAKASILPQTIVIHAEKKNAVPRALSPKPVHVDSPRYDVESVEAYNAVSAYGPLPDYLSDVGFDGGLEVDDQGKLMINLDMRRLFDFFLAAVRVEGMAVCSARINEYITMTLPPDTAKEAGSVWSSYQTYKERMKDLYREFSEKRDTDRDTYNALVISMVMEHRELRRQCMGEAVVQAFFSEEEAEEDQTLSQME